MSYVPLYVYFIALSFLVSLFFYRVNKDIIYLRLFPFFLLVSFGVEAYGIYLWYIRRDTATLYNFFSLFEFIFYFFTLYHVVRNSLVKKLITILSFSFIPLCLINIFFIQGLGKLHTVTYSLGCLLIIGLTIFYFYELFRLPKFISLTRAPAFWISSGLLFFYCCSFPYFALSDLLEGSAPFILNNFDKIINVLNILLYSLFSIAFVCRIRVRKSIL